MTETKTAPAKRKLSGKRPRKNPSKTSRDVRLAVAGAVRQPAKMGRPLRAFDATVAAEIVARVELGLPLKTATAGRASFDVLLRWMEENEDFAVSLQKGDADEQLRLLAAMETAPAGRWQVFAWKLERMWPHIYGQKAQLNVENTHKFEVNEELCDKIAGSWAKLAPHLATPAPSGGTPPIDVEQIEPQVATG